MIHTGPDDDGKPEVDDGFVSIAKAERMRRAEATKAFRAKNDALYLDAVRASADLKLALQRFEEAKVKIAQACNGLVPSDIFDAIQADSIGALSANAIGVAALAFKQTELAAKKATKAA